MKLTQRDELKFVMSTLVLLTAMIMQQLFLEFYEAISKEKWKQELLGLASMIQCTY